MKKKFLAIVTAGLIGTTAFASVKTVQVQEEHLSNCLELKKNRAMKK